MKLIAQLQLLATSIAISFIVMPELSAQAATFTEVGNAGQSLLTAQDVGVNINAILGRLNPTSDVDLYQLNLSSGLFGATTVGNVTNNLDTMLWLFDSTGKGIVGNDDSLNTSQSTITANLNAGIYYLGISNYDLEPTSSLGFIFDYSSLSQRTQLLSPTGLGSTAPLTDIWQVGINGINPRGTGQYRILFNQSTVAPQSVPEPDVCFGLAIFGLGGLFSLLQRANSLA